MNTDLMFSSAYDSWATEQKFFDKLNEKYNFDIDVCAEEGTKKCPVYIDKATDCLKTDWIEFAKAKEYQVNCFMNPPYGREIGKFIKRAYEQSLNGCRVVCLLPARTDTKWFHEYCVRGEIEFIKGRLTFGNDAYWEWIWEQEYINGKKNSLYKKHGKKNSAPFPSMIVVFSNPELINQP